MNLPALIVQATARKDIPSEVIMNVEKRCPYCKRMSTEFVAYRGRKMCPDCKEGAQIQEEETRRDREFEERLDEG